MYRIVLVSILFLISSVATAQEFPCSPREQMKSYLAFSNASKSTNPVYRKKAYETAKRYMQTWSKCDDRYTKSARDFIESYELAEDRLDLHGLVFGAAPNHSRAYEIGKKILARKPDDLDTLMSLSFAGNAALQKGSSALVPDTLTYALKAVQLIESGKTPSTWVPFKTRCEALANLHLWIAEAHWPGNKDADAALPFYLKVATMDSPLKKSALVYGRLALVYELSVYEKARAEYRFDNPRVGEVEQRKEFERLNQIIDRMMDYNARAVVTAGTDPKYAQLKSGSKETLTQFYKYRHNGTTEGLEQFIATVMSTPLPEP